MVRAGLAGIGLLAGACGSNTVAATGPKPHLVAAIPPTTAPPTTVAPAPTTTAAPTTTTSTVPPTTTTTVILGPGGCPVSSLSGKPLPAGAFDVSEAYGAFTSDHKPDQLIVYAVPSPDGSPFRLREVMASGYSVETPLATSAPPSLAAQGSSPVQAVALGGYDAGGRGYQMAFVQTGVQGTLVTESIYDFSGCSLVPVTNVQGQVMSLSAGQNTGQYSAFGCAKDTSGQPSVVTETATSIDSGTTYSVVRNQLSFQDDQLVTAGTTTYGYTTPSSGPQAPPEMDTLSCGSFGSVASGSTPTTTTTSVPAAGTTSTTAAGSGSTTTSSSSTTTTAP